MEGRKPDLKKRAEGNQRLGSLSSGFLSPTQRPGRLNGGVAGPQTHVKQEEQAGPSNGFARGPLPGSGTSETKPTARKTFRPNVPAKSDPRRRPPGSAASSSAAARDSDAFKELIKQAQSDKGWQEKARQARPQQSPMQAGGIGLGPSSSAGQSAPGRATRSSADRGPASGGRVPKASKDARSLVPVREDVTMSEDEDYNEDGGGKVQGPMLDYSRYYPTTLPMAKPRHDGSEAMSDEGTESMADKLELLGPGSEEPLLVLVQVPDLLPSKAPPLAPDLAAARQRSLRREDQPPAAIAQGLKSLPSGKIGQLVVYESGAVKMQIGSVLYDLEPGISPNIREEVAGVWSPRDEALQRISNPQDPEDHPTPFLGEVKQHAVITPDMHHLLSGKPMPALLPAPGLWKPVESKVVVQDSIDTAAPMDVDVKPEA